MKRRFCPKCKSYKVLLDKSTLQQMGVLPEKYYCKNCSHRGYAFPEEGEGSYYNDKYLTFILGLVFLGIALFYSFYIPTIGFFFTVIGIIIILFGLFKIKSFNRS